MPDLQGQVGGFVHALAEAWQAAGDGGGPALLEKGHVHWLQKPFSGSRTMLS